LITGEHVPDRLGQPPREIDLGDLGAALLADPSLGLLVAVAVDRCGARMCRGLDEHKLMPERISEQAWQASFNVAAGASPSASYACVDTWLTDFRADLPKIDVPVLVVRGTEDRILPFEATAARLPDLIDDVKLVAVEGGPHNIAWTHPDEVNGALLEFIGAPTRVAA
jgi:pimeloyl-ACP methyl ester carboxylesterase